jgi:bifunctional oligoribonuclease and PAP phosphatase NrnA
MTPWTEVATALQEAEQIVIVTHVSPDGDAIGSMLGLANALVGMGKQVTAAVDGGVPAALAFLPARCEVAPSLEGGRWDLMIAVDCGDESRMGQVGQIAQKNSTRVANIDHHPTNTHFGDHNVVLADASSTAEMILTLLQDLGVSLNPVIAEPLLTGIVTDTNGFRTSNVRPATLAAASVLVEAGVPLSPLMARTVNRMTHADFLVWQRVLPGIHLEDGLIYGIVRQEDWSAAGLGEYSDSGLISLMIGLEEARIAVVIKENADGTTGVSLRCRPGYDVAKIAVSLGGGGHRQAAGATVADTSDAVLARVLAALRAELGHEE